jgi:hypothetical protein
MDKLEAARLSLTPMRKVGSNSAFGARCWRPMEFQYVTLGFPRDGLLFIALIVPLIFSFRRIHFLVSVLLSFSSCSFDILFFCSQRFCRRVVLPTDSLHSPILAASSLDTVIPLCEKAKIIAEKALKVNPTAQTKNHHR